MPPLWAATTVPWTSIRSSLLKQPRSNPSLYQKADGVLHLFRQGGIVVALQAQRRAKPDPRRPGSGHLPGVMEDLVQAGNAHRYDRNVEPGADHPDAAPEGIELPVGGPLAFGEDEQGVALREQGADVAQSLAGAGLALGQREGVEEQRREVVVEAVFHPRLAAVLLRKEMGLEELLCHRDGPPIAPAGWQRPQDHRAVQVALVVGGEDDGAGKALQVLEPFHLHPREYSADGQDPGRQAGLPHPRERPAPVPGGEGPRALLRGRRRRPLRRGKPFR